MKYTQLASDNQLQKTVRNLKKNGFEVDVVETREKAKKNALEKLPEGASVLDMTSVTLQLTGITEEIRKSGKYESVHEKVFELDREKDGREIIRLRSVPDYAIGSVHAITESGSIMVASGSGSQIPAYSYSAKKVIFVVGSHKLVKDIDQGMDRIYSHSLPLESERVKKAYGIEGSNVRRLLIYNSEPIQGRVHIILVKEVLGF